MLLQKAAHRPRMTAMSAINGMMKPPRSSLPLTFSPAGATSVLAGAACCAAAIVGVAIKATDAVAAIIPLKPTSASPFVLESDLLDFEPYLIEASLAVYPEMSTSEIPETPP